MKLSLPKETKLKENLVIHIPDVVKHFFKKGFEVIVEAGIRLTSFILTKFTLLQEFKLSATSSKIHSEGDMILKVKYSTNKAQNFVLKKTLNLRIVKL
jgi:alanine dehydrogenase